MQEQQQTPVPTRRGRPTKLTQQVLDTVIAAVVAGNFIETAAALAGVNKSTLYDWLNRGNTELEAIDKGHEPQIEEQIYADFAFAMERAIALSEATQLQGIDKAAETDWKARAWRLEKRFPEKYARKVEATHTLRGDKDAPIKTESTVTANLNGHIVHEGLTDEALLKIAQGEEPTPSDGSSETGAGPSSEGT
jgi:transposase